MKNWKAILGVVAIFLLGMLAGGLVVGGVVARRVHRLQHGQPLFTPREVTHFLKRRLALDATQQPQVLAIVQDAQNQMQDVRKTTEIQAWGVISNAIEKARPILRPEQREKLDQLVAERRARRLE